MTRYLLDSHIFLWILADDPLLGKRTRAEILDTQNQVFVSAATVWELTIKAQLGKLKIPHDLESIIENAGFNKLAISLFHAQQVANLPLFHKDPFDRMLISQAQAEGLVLMSKDKHFSQYGIKLFDPCR
jgi:PIN domain nuclease of toxin-antitoxin system